MNLARAVRSALWAAVLCIAVPSNAQLTAERITVANAAQRLFSGSDATGGVGDWYLSNGVVEAIIDNAAFNPDLLARGIAVPNQYLLSPTGGSLIDLGLVGKNNDQLTQLYTVANLSPENALFYTSVSTDTSLTGRVGIVADGFVVFAPFSTPAQPTLPVRTTYSVAAGLPWIDISTTVVNAGATSVPLFNLTDVVPVINSKIPFAPFPGRGFSHPALVLTPEGIAASLGIYPYVVIPGQLGPEHGVIDTVTLAKAGEVSYGIVGGSLFVDPDAAGSLPPMPIPNPVLLGLTTHTVVGVGNVFDPALSPSVPAGGSFIYTRRVIVSDRNDVASITNAIFSSFGPGAGTVVGDIDADGDPNVQVSLLVTGKLTQLFGNAPVPMTHVKTDATGKFALVLPQGDYSVTIVSPERADVTATFQVGPGVSTITLPNLSATGTVSYRIRDGNDNIPARLTFVGVGNPNPHFSRQYDSFVVDPKTGQPLADRRAGSLVGAPALNFVITSEGAGQQTIRPGRYRVTASRGLEYSVDVKTIDVQAGAATEADFSLKRVVDTAGWASADFHIHSARSFDSSAPIEDRVRSYVAEGLEILVSTDHNFILDYAPVLTALRLNGFAKSMVGNELTSFLPTARFPQAFGHHNVFPQTVDATAPRRGAPLTEYVNSATMYDRSRQRDPAIPKAVQLNHPRAGVIGLTLIGLFNTIGYDPTKAIPPVLMEKSFLGTNTTNLDFDAMEIYNGDRVSDYLQVQNDWFSLLDQGIDKTGTAVSDSHKIVLEAAGYPRSYIALTNDGPSQITQITDGAVVDSVLRKRVIGTSGPFIQFTIDGNPIGSLVRPRTWLGSRMDIRVSAPAWVPVTEVRLYGNGRLLRKFDASTTPAVVPAPADSRSMDGVNRFHATFRISPSRDTYYTVEAGVPLPEAVDTNGDGVVDRGDTNGDGAIDSRDTGIPQPSVGGVYAEVAPGFVPIAFTNPIWMDRNGNGRFDPPGIDTTRVKRVTLSATAVAEEDHHHHSGALIQWQQMRVTAADVHRFWTSAIERGYHAEALAPR